jgi:streptogramin lyase
MTLFGRRCRRMLAVAVVASLMPGSLLLLASCSGTGTGYRLLTPTFTEFPLPAANGGPSFITLGPDGNLWFTEFIGEADWAHHSSGRNHGVPRPYS